MVCKTNSCVKIWIYLVISMCYCEARDTSENPVITIENYPDLNLYYVELNKSLQIIIKGRRAGYVRCYDYFSGLRVTFIENEYPNYDMDSVINITRVTPAMSTKWCCEINQENHDRTHVNNIFMRPDDEYEACFDIAVKGALSVVASINGEYLNFTRVGLNVKHDAETSFHFINGQNIELICFNAESNYKYFAELFKVGIEYFNENGKKILKVPQSYTTAIRTKLTSQQDRFYIDCICYKDIDREHRYRIYFYEKRLEYDPDIQKNGIRLSVNGLLQHFVTIKGTYLEYQPFGYIYGEVINVTCEVEREYSNNSLQFYFLEKQINNFKVVRMDNKIVVILNTSALLWNEATLICEKIHAEKRYYARMKFESDFKPTGTATSIGVFGLPRQNILYQYFSNSSWTTVYKYSVNESINLGCVLKTESPMNCSVEWNFNSGESLLNDSYIMTTDKDFTVLCAAENFTRKLTESDDNKVIMCSAYDKYNELNVAEVQLQLKNTTNSENSRVETSYLGIYIGFPTFIMAVILVAMAWVWYKKNAPVPAPTPNANMPKPFYVNEMFQRNPNEGIYIRPESHYKEEHPHEEVHHYEEVHHCKEAPNNGVQEDTEMTTIPENVSTTQLDNAVPKRSRYSEPYDHHYSEINNSQCSQPTEGPQRLSKMYNEPYDHCV